MKIRKIAKSNIQQKTLLVFVAAFVIVGAVCSLFYYRTIRFIESSRKVENVHRILYETEEIISALKDADSGQRGYIITGDKNFLVPYNLSLGKIDKHLDEVRRLTADNRAQQQWLNEIEPLVSEQRVLLAEGISRRDKLGFAEAQSFIASGKSKARMDAAHEIIGKMKGAEQNLLARRVEESAEAERSTLQTLATISLLMVLFLCLGYYQIRKDISEVERAELLLKDERDFAAAVMDNNRSLTLVLDREARIIRFNQTCEQVSGYLFEDVRGKIFWEVLPPPEQQAMIAAAFTRLQPRDYPTTHENYWLSRKGELRLVSWSNNALLDENGNIKYTIGTGVDITEQRQAETALVEREKLAVLNSEISLALIESQTLPEMLDACTKSLVKHLDAAFARIWTLDETGGTLELQASAGLYTHLDGAHSRVPVGNFKIGLIAEERQPHLTNSVADDPRIGDQEWVRREKMQSFAGYPLLIGEKLIGVVALFAHHKLNETIVDALGSAAVAISLGIERRRTEQALQQNHSLLGSTLEATDNAIVAINFEGDISAYNQKFLSVWGLTEEELITAGNLRKLSHHWTLLKDPEEYLRKSNEYIRNHPEQSNYITIEFKDGRIYERFSHPQILNNQIVGRVLSFRDITAQTEAERALRESEQRNRELVDKSLGLISTHDLEGRWLSLNPATASALGGAPEHFVGKPVAETLVAAARPLFNDYLKIIKEKREVAGLMHIVTVAGEQRILTYNNVLVEEPGKPAYILGHAQDITPLRRAEEEKRIAQQRLQFHLENSRIALIEWSQDWRILSWSPGAEKIFGWRAAEVLGKTIEKDFKFIYDEDKPGVKVVQDELSGGKDMARPRANRNYTKDGAVITCEWYSSVQLDAKGEFSSIMALAHDVTERRQMEAELREARDAALESARLKSEFLANMSHEIRTPMNGVIGMTDLLIGTHLNGAQREYAETIKNSANSLLTVINDILDFSKIEAGKLHFETIDFDVRNTVESTLDLFAEQAQSKGLELASLVEYNVPVALRGDPGRLRQILTNLIGNGVKFTAAGEVIVQVSLKRETEQFAWLDFAVSDTGIGIKKEAQTNLFQAFTQADGSTTRKYGGTGLGLAISKQLIELMDGKIKVVSEYGSGSIFSFAVRFEKQPAPKIKKIQFAPSLEKMRVLIVDDNATNRLILEHQIKSRKMTAELASDGASALLCLRQAAAAGKPFDLAILDLMMPEMDGFELAKLIKADASINSAQLVLMPSFGTRGHGNTAREAGIAGYLIKPVRQSDLFDCLTTVMSEAADARPTTRREADAPELVTKHTLEENRYQAKRQNYILVAEDNLINQKVIRGQLERLGYHADIVANGAEALSALQKRSYSLILMDCQMPEMDGYEATQEFRRRENGGAQTPVIAVTANAMQGEREKCLAAGMNDYISKPLKIDVLQQKIERWLKLADEQPPENAALPENNGNASLVDLDVLHDITDNDSQLLEEIVSLYLEQTDEFLISLSDAVEQNDATEIYRLAHKTLGSSATCGMRTMVEPLKQLEHMGRSGNLENSRAIFLKAQQNYHALQKYLLELLDRRS